MKVYLVLNHSGSYDSSHTSVDKIFKTKEQAEDYISKVKTRMDELKVLFDNMPDNGHDENDDIYDKALEQFEKDFPATIYDAWDGNLFVITERELE